MADKKISQLPAATLPLAGTEVLPIVQSSTTDQVSVANLTAGRAVSAASLTLTSSPLPIASGGTNQTAFTAPSGNVKGLVYFDGTTLGNNATVTNVGYDTSTNTVKTKNLETSGTLGVAVTPSAWGSQHRVSQVSYASFAYDTTNNYMNLSRNAYAYSGDSWKYIVDGTAERYLQTGGVHQWLRTASGTAGNAITWTTSMNLSATSDLTIAGSTATKASGTTWANPSDIRLKNNVQDFTKGLAELEQVQPRIWEYNGKGGTTAGMKGIGVVADEIEKVLPETVDTYKAKLNDSDDEEIDIKRFDATEITWLLVNAVKELSAKVTTLETQLAAK